MIFEITREHTKHKAARAIPDAFYERGAWWIKDPEPRAAVVALKLFPHLMWRYPELAALRDSTYQDAKPVDYASKLGLRIGARRVREAMAERGWSFDKAKTRMAGVGPDYQSLDLGYAVACLRKHKGFYLGWSRGGGKTLGTAAIIDDLDLNSTVIVAPNSAKSITWGDELDWALPWVEVLTLPNDAAKRDQCLERAQYLHRHNTPFVLVIHYEALALVAGKQPNNPKTGKPWRRGTKILDGWKKLGIDWDLAAFDEGHRLANPDSQQSKAALKLRKQSTYALMLSGSVFQNSWEEVYGPLHVLFPATYSNRWAHWNLRFFDYVENGYGNVNVGIKEDRIDALREELGRFMVVRDKINLAKPSTVTVPLSAEQRKVYDDVAEMMFAELPDGQTIKTSAGVAMMTRLRQVACGLDVFDHESLRDSSKLDATIDVIKTHLPRGDDFVVFGWFKASLEALARRLDEEGIECWVVHGDVPQKERTQIIREFQNGKRRVLLGTISTMGESVNLQRANHVIRIDRSWNPALNQQAVDRCDRQGQKRDVYLTDIIAEDTVDDLQVLPNLANKEALRAVVFGGQR